MTYRNGMATAPAEADPVYPAGEHQRLAAANVNPVTGLATDYLNHFNEAIMLLEMLPAAAEFREDFLRWRPMSYRAHFAISGFETRDAAIAAFESADPRLRAEFVAVTDAMTAMLQATRAALLADPAPALLAPLAGKTVAALKPMVARAGALINGEAGRDDTQAAQAAVDDLMKR